MAALETVDIPAVEIMRSGGPVYAIGSPVGGDFYSREDLEGMAAAHVALGDEIRAPIKLGHSDRQQLLAASGLTKGEMPAAGWLDSATFRVEEAADGATRLLADAKAVPKKLADLMEVGAYRTRSSEIRSYASQKTQQEYPWVVDGLALMGEQLPAIQTLDDVHKLYQRAEIDEPAGETSFVIRHNAGAVWSPDSSLEDLRSDLNEALNPYGYDMPGVQRYWVRDVARSSNVALVSDYNGGDDAWVVPFTVDDATDTVTPAPRPQWTAAEQTWVATSMELARKNSRGAESRPMELTLTDEQATAVRERLGLDADAEITADALIAADEARANELAEAKTKLEELETRKNEAEGDAEKRIRKLESDVKEEQTRRFEMERTTDLTAAVRAGKIDPADLDAWKKDYEENQAGTRRILERLKPDPTLQRELGRDDLEDGEQEELDDDEYKRDFERRHGMKAQV